MVLSCAALRSTFSASHFAGGSKTSALVHCVAETDLWAEFCSCALLMLFYEKSHIKYHPDPNPGNFDHSSNLGCCFIEINVVGCFHIYLTSICSMNNLKLFISKVIAHYLGTKFCCTRS